MSSMASSPRRGARSPSAKSGLSASVHNHSPSQLTPRSKIKAMMAGFDDSESESGHEKLSRSRPYVASRRQKDHELSPASNGGSVSADSSEDGEEDEDVAIRPRGRLAQRMQITKSTSGGPHEEESEDDGNAYQRIKTQLLGNRKKVAERGSTKSPRLEPLVDNTQVYAEHGSSGSQEGTPRSSTPLQRSSPGLFVSPGPSKGPSQTSVAGMEDSDDELPAISTVTSRFQALVARKREEREAKEAEAARQREERQREQQVERVAEHDDISTAESDVDSVAEERLTQTVRPPRKASKKALEEMNRETQRMSRNMQLAPEARTKKKIKKQSLFDRFNFKPANYQPEECAEPDRPAASSSPPVSGVATPKSTPPTSPSLEDVHQKDGGFATMNAEVDTEDHEDHDSLPDLDAVISSRGTLTKHFQESALDKGKGIAGRSSLREQLAARKQGQKIALNDTQLHVRQIRVRQSKKADDSDSDLEILPKGYKASVWDRLSKDKAKEGNSLHALRFLANLTSPGKQRSKKGTVSLPELQVGLQKRARLQAIKEREAHIQQLRDRGIIIQSAEDRAKDHAEVEDLFERARREGEEITKREKAAAKKERGEDREHDPLDEDDEEDADWEENGELHLSGSEEEEVEDGVDAEEHSEEEETADADVSVPAPPDRGGVSFVDGEASETEGDEDDRADEELGDVEEADPREDDVDDDDEDEDEEENTLPLLARRKAKSRLVVEEDEEEETPVVSPPPKAPSSVPKSARKLIIPGLPASDELPVGLTQMFAATMGDSQTQPVENGNLGESQVLEQDSFDFLRHLPGPSMPDPETAMMLDSPEVIRDSQATQTGANPFGGDTDNDITLNFSQSQNQQDSFRLMPQYPIGTQVSEFPDPTQDVGFSRSSPLPERFIDPPHSTIDTVVLDKSQDDDSSPVAMKKGRLMRRGERETSASQDEDDFEVSADAFNVMRKASKKKATQSIYDKKKSEAKTLVEEQAEESEDEYAGLGGASDEDSGNEEDAAALKDMLDDQTQDVDESRLAALFADKDRANDEKQVEKLFKDITNGMLRRKRGADYDLSDSDDDGEARRRMKRRNFAKMRKALLEDENIGKIASNPKKMAFLRAIEDREPDDELDFLDNPEESQPIFASQSAESQEQRPSTTVETVSSNKRKRDPTDPGSDIENRPPPHMRRSHKANHERQLDRPSSFLDIRESLSTLIQEPNQIVPASPTSSTSDSDSDSDSSSINKADTRKTTSNHTNPRRTKPASSTVIDRISLLRQRTSSTSGATTVNQAFAAPGAGPTPSFRVPALLRRATTNASEHFAASADGERRGSASGLAGTGNSKEGAVKRGGTKSCSVNWSARERGRRSEAGGVADGSGVVKSKAKGKGKAREKRLGLGGRLAGLVGGTFE